MVLCFRIRSHKQDTTRFDYGRILDKFIILTTNRIENELPKETPTATGENQLYAEIIDQEPSSAPEHNSRAASHVSAPQATGPTPKSHPYDGVVLDVPKTGGDYQLTPCEAYGVH